MSDETTSSAVPTTLRGSAVLLAWLACGSAAAGSVLGLLGGGWWLLDLFSHFRFQYAAVLLGAVVILAIGRKWKTVAIGALALGLNLFLLAPFWITPNQPTGEGAALRVLAFNVLTINTRYEAASDWVRSQGADVLVLQELNREWFAFLERGLAGYTSLETPTIREDNFGLAVYVRDGLTVTGFEYFDDAAGVPRVEVVVEVGGEGGGRSVRLLAVHTLPPVSARYSEFRRRQLEEAAERARTSAEPVVLLGDLNATRWSAPLRRLLAETDLRDSAEGFGYCGTWPSGLGWTGMIPIDQVLVGPAFRVEGRRVGPGLGSDHRAVVVDLVVTATSAQTDR